MPGGRQKSRRFRHIIDFRSQCVRLLESLKRDRSSAPRESSAKLALSIARYTFSGSVQGRLCGIAAISRDFQSNPGGFLCTSDLLVERAEIELFLEVCGTCKSPHVRELHPFLQQ
jgi:hypothetical protein